MSRRVLISGSVAYDTIMVFDGHFKDHILPDRVHMLNVAFLTPTLKREFGGCAANIAYNLRLLGGEPVILATVGRDAGDYLDCIAAMGIDNGSTDFRKVFADMGIPAEWILTPKSDPHAIREAFQVFSQSAVRASQAAAFSATALAGFAGP